MLTGDLRLKIDAVWNAFWAGGIANPLKAIEHLKLEKLTSPHSNKRPEIF
jgi:hypothetical protein